MVSQGHDRFGNVVRIPKKDTAGSLVGPLAIPVMAATIGGTAAAIPEVEGAATAGREMLTQLAKEYPKAAKVVGAYTSWLAVHMAHKMGIPLPKILEVIGE